MQCQRRLRNFLIQEKIEVVHAHSRAAVRIAHGACKNLPTVLVSTIHGQQHLSFGKKFFDHYGERVLAVCEELAIHLERDFGMNPKKIRVLRNPVPLPTNPQKSPPTSHLRIGFIGRRSGPKGENTLRLLLNTILPLCAERAMNSSAERAMNPSAERANEANAERAIEFLITGGPAEAWPQELHEQIAEVQKLHPEIQFSFRDHLNLDEEMNSLAVVVGAGRVAISALQKGIPVLAFGEARWEGLVQPNNWAQVLRTNFGDIAAEKSPFADPQFWQHLKADFRPLFSLPSRGEDVAAPVFAERWTDSDRRALQTLSQNEFSTEKIVQGVWQTYLEAREEKHLRGAIPILMYHKVVIETPNTKHKIFVHRDLFKKHLTWLEKQGKKTLSFQTLSAFKDGRLSSWEFPEKPVILTFDDGYLNNLEYAVPLLQKHRMTATFYLLADPRITSNSWDWTKDPSEPRFELLDPAGRQALVQAGMEIGSHGFRHEDITTKSLSDAELEVGNSKSQLEKELGTPVLSYAYTFGRRREDLDSALRLAGYEFAVNTDSGALSSRENWFSLFRVNIFPHDGYFSFRKKTSPKYRQKFYRKRGR